MPLYEVHYQVTRPVDEHPTGSRIRVTEAPSHLAACHQVRMGYGILHATAVLVDGVRLAGRDMASEGMPNHPWLAAAAGRR